jgi:hypothetical protein
MKTQLEFLARTQTERKVRIDAQKLVPVGSPMIRAIAVLNWPSALPQRARRGGIPISNPWRWWESRRLSPDRLFINRSGALLSGSSLICA